MPVRESAFVLARVLSAGLCCSGLCFAAQAQPAQTVASVSTASSQPAAPHAAASPALHGITSNAATAAEIQRINEQMALLQAQLNRLELEAKIAAKRKEIEAATVVAPAAAQDAPDSLGGTPSVLSVAGLKGQLEAVLVFPGGLSQRVKVGDVIGQRRVGRVSLNEVLLSDLQGRRQQRLAFGSTPLTREGSAPPGPPTSTAGWPPPGSPALAR